MICYVLAMGKQHLGPHVVVGYGIKIFWPGLFITSPDNLEVMRKVTHANYPVRQEIFHKCYDSNNLFYSYLFYKNVHF